jgi:hypothetical protein
MTRGHFWALFGVANVLGYAASFVMKKEKYENLFAYKGDNPSFSRWLFSQVGATKLDNILWTAPVLIAHSIFTVKKFGASFATKFFFAALFGVWVANASFNPASGLKSYSLVAKQGWDWTSNHPQRDFIMGADAMATCAVYFWLAYFKVWPAIPVLLLYDLGYYGPAQMGGSFVGIAAALTML